jgi:hypothetical protein
MSAFSIPPFEPIQTSTELSLTCTAKGEIDLSPPHFAPCGPSSSHIQRVRLNYAIFSAILMSRKARHQSVDKALMTKRGMCMSTFTVDNELYQRATEAAAAQGKRVDEFVGETLLQALTLVQLIVKRGSKSCGFVQCIRHGLRS